MEHVGIEFKPSELVAVRVYDMRSDQTIAILSLEKTLEWDNRLDCLIAWLEGVQAAYCNHPINTTVVSDAED